MWHLGRVQVLLGGSCCCRAGELLSFLESQGQWVEASCELGSSIPEAGFHLGSPAVLLNITCEHLGTRSGLSVDQRPAGD